MSGGGNDDLFDPNDPNAPAGGDFDFQVNETPSEDPGFADPLAPLDPLAAPVDPTLDDPFAAPSLDPALDPLAEAPALDAAPAAEPDALAAVKTAAEDAGVAQAQNAVPAALPFSLMIEGPLRPEEREKLIDILSRENMGIREIDLEPQFASGRVLIPRISEYAGILLVQALRGISAKMRFGPSDQIFSTVDTESTTQIQTGASGISQSTGSTASAHPAESIVCTTESTLPDCPSLRSIDTVTASAHLGAKIVDAENSPRYQELLEALTRELKYKAHRKGATVLLSFKVQLLPLHSPTEYRMTVSALAAVATQPEPIDPVAPSESDGSLDEPLPPWA